MGLHPKLTTLLTFGGLVAVIYLSLVGVLILVTAWIIDGAAREIASNVWIAVVGGFIATEFGCTKIITSEAKDD